MDTQLIDGKSLAKEIRQNLSGESQAVLERLRRKPTLAVVLVGDNPASQVYVKSKAKQAVSCGINALDLRLPASISQAALEEELKKLSAREDIDGILLQLPLPDGLNEFPALLCIDPDKDVDGLHPYNQGLLLNGVKGIRPCTPLGCMALLDKALNMNGGSSDLSGKNAVVVGRSVLVGKPVALMLLERNCTVTICHSRTADLKQYTLEADIIIAAVGRPKMITADYVKSGAIVIDVGINRTDDGKLVGDVDFEGVKAKASAITPVPGGVGPMTIAMLLSNTVFSAKKKISK